MSELRMDLILQEGKYIAHVARKEIASELYNSLEAQGENCGKEMILSDCIKNVFRYSSVHCNRVAEKKLNHLVLELGPDCFYLKEKCKGEEGKVVLIKHSTYDDYPFLNDLDNAQFTPLLLKTFPRPLFCVRGVVVEIQDRRLSNDCEPRYALWKLTNGTVLQYIGLLMNECGRFTDKQRNFLEAQFLLMVSEKLCLKNNPVVAVVSNWLQYSSNVLCNPELKSMAKRNKERTRWKKNSNILPADERTLLGFISHKRNAEDSGEDLMRKCMKVDDDDEVPYALIKHKKPLLALDKLSEIITHHVPVPVLSLVQKGKFNIYEPQNYWDLYMQKEEQEEYIMELFSEDFPKVKRMVQSTKVKIRKIPVEEQYYGELSISSEQQGQDSTSAEFLLGSRAKVEKFINKFIRVFTEEDTKYVQKIHRGHNFENVTCTEGLKRAMGGESVMLSELDRTSSRMSCYENLMDENATNDEIALCSSLMEPLHWHSGISDVPLC